MKLGKVGSGLVWCGRWGEVWSGVVRCSSVFYSHDFLQEMMMKIAFKKSSQITLDPRMAANEIKRIGKLEGQVTPPLIVKNSRNKNAKLHNYFIWNNAICGERYRESQAAHLLRCLIVVTEREGREPLEVRLYHDLDGAPKHPGEYCIITDILSDEEKRKQLLQQAYDELQDWRMRWRDLQEFTDFFLMADKLEAARK